MLLSKVVKLKWNTKNRKYYENIGYIFTQYGDEFDVKVEDLTPSSKAVVEVECDFCHNVVVKKKYQTYNVQHHEKYGEGTRPDLLILGYPVVTADERYWHMGSFKNLLLEDFNDINLREYLSLETQVKSDAPDLFLWGTITDESVHVMNSILLLEAYKKNNCNIEYHCFPMGGHGLSVCNLESAENNIDKVNPYVEKWIKLVDSWLEEKLK